MCRLSPDTFRYADSGTRAGRNGNGCFNYRLFKKSNKRNKRRILAAILIVTLLLGSIWGYRTYFYPAPLKNTALIDYAVTVKDNKTIQIKDL